MKSTDIQLECKKNIRNLRESYGYSQAKFAEFFNMTTEAYRRVEVGPVNVSLELLYMINRKFGVPTDYLIYGDKSHYDDTYIEVQKYLKEQIADMQDRLKEYKGLLPENNSEE